MNLTFWGAARQVTGSMFLLETADHYRILVDCGLSYERHDTLESNEQFPFDPAGINVLVLTHAHIDHSGNIPTLIRKGFNGHIFCTEPTAALAENLLKDSVQVQIAETRGRKGKKGKKQGGRPLYGVMDVEETMDRLITLSFNKPFKLRDEVTLTLIPAGHILGAASALFEIRENGTTKRIGFTGDLGKTGSKIVVDPEVMPDLDYLISESTYGNRTHSVSGAVEDELFTYIKKNCIDQPGRLVIPAFSVGRTQAILFTLNKLWQDGKTRGIRVFTDSRLGIKSTHVHSAHIEYLNQEAQDFFRNRGELFDFPDLRVLETEYEQRDPEYYTGPCIIVSSAGMVEGGRIQQHVRNNIQNPLCTILIAGFCAEGTLGHRLLQGQPTINIRGKEHAVYARVTSTDVFSAHPDRNGLLNYLRECQNPSLKTIFLTHGDGPFMDDFAGFLAEQGITNTRIPQKGEQFTL